MNPAVIYAAKSTLDKRGSIPTQLEDCRQMARDQGWAIISEHTDENASAWKGDRGPGLIDAMEAATRAASEHGSCILVAQHSDRFARGDGKQARHLGELLFWAMKADVELRSVQDDSTFTNPLLAFAMGERNAEDSRRKSEAVKAGMRRRAHRGQHLGAAPYGYRWVGPNGAADLLPDPERAVIVMRIFRSYVAGESQKQIARALTREGVPALRGGDWHQGTVWRIIANPVYKGCVRVNGEVIPGEHDGIVPTELWEQARLLREAAARTPSGGRGRRPNGRHLFIKGHLRCGLCGGAMVPRSYSNRGGSLYSTYQCYTRIRLGTEACEQEPVKREAIDGPVMDYFMQAVVDQEATRREMLRAADAKLAEIAELRTVAERDEREVRESLARIKRDYRRGALRVEDWDMFRDELTSELEGAQAKLERFREQEARVRADAALEADSGTVAHLQAIREAVIGTVQESHGIDAVRSALLRLFESFTLHRTGEAEQDRDVFETRLMGLGRDAGQELIPKVREDAIAGYGPAGWTAKHRRIALPMGENNVTQGLQT